MPITLKPDATFGYLAFNAHLDERSANGLTTTATASLNNRTDLIQAWVVPVVLEKTVVGARWQPIPSWETDKKKFPIRFDASTGASTASVEFDFGKSPAADGAAVLITVKGVSSTMERFSAVLKQAAGVLDAGTDKESALVLRAFASHVADLRSIAQAIDPKRVEGLAQDIAQSDAAVAEWMAAAMRLGFDTESIAADTELKAVDRALRLSLHDAVMYKPVP